MSGGKLSGIEIELAEEEESAAAEGLEIGQPAGGVFEALDDGIKPFGRG